MKIDPNTLGLPPANSTGAGRAFSGRSVEKLYGSPAGSASSASEAGGSLDQVQLSSLSSALSMLSPESPEREAHLEELSRLVASGEYKVDARQLSRSLAEEYSSAPPQAGEN